MRVYKEEAQARPMLAGRAPSQRIELYVLSNGQKVWRRLTVVLRQSGDVVMHNISVPFKQHLAMLGDVPHAV